VLYKFSLIRAGELPNWQQTPKVLPLLDGVLFCGKRMRKLQVKVEVVRFGRKEVEEHIIASNDLAYNHRSARKGSSDEGIIL